jgi:hypothetical protein
MAYKAHKATGSDSTVQAVTANVQVVLFAPSVDAGNRWINALINEYTVMSGIEIYRTMESLTKRLCRPGNSLLIAVLFAAQQETLSELLDIHDLLAQVRIILVLPNRRPETISCGHSLRPRYMAFGDTATAEIAAVLDTMVGKIDRGRQKQSGSVI